jgi:hypothetical protein
MSRATDVRADVPKPYVKLPTATIKPTATLYPLVRVIFVSGLEFTEDQGGIQRIRKAVETVPAAI